MVFPIVVPLKPAGTLQAYSGKDKQIIGKADYHEHYNVEIQEYSNTLQGVSESLNSTVNMISKLEKFTQQNVGIHAKNLLLKP